MLRPIVIALLSGALALAVLAAPASADVRSRIIYDCQHSASGYLTGSYTKAQLRDAKSNLPADVLEYSSCYDQIGYALTHFDDGTRTGGDGGPGGGSNPTGGGGSGGGGTDTSGLGDGFGDGGLAGGSATDGGLGAGAGSGGADGAAPPAAPAEPHVGTQAPVRLAGVDVKPGELAAVGNDPNALPTPLVVFLALLGAGAIGAAGMTIGRRVIARRRP